MSEEQKEKQSMSKGSMFGIGLGVGVVVGAILGLLFAPVPGKVARAKVVEKARVIVNKLKRKGGKS